MLNYPKLPYNTLKEKDDALSLPNKLSCPLNQVGRVHLNDATCLLSCHLDSERRELSVNGEDAVSASERAAVPLFVPHLRKRHPLLINSHRRSSAATLLPAARHPVASQFPLLTSSRCQHGVIFERPFSLSRPLCLVAGVGPESGPLTWRTCGSCDLYPSICAAWATPPGEEPPAGKAPGVSEAHKAEDHDKVAIRRRAAGAKSSVVSTFNAVCVCISFLSLHLGFSCPQGHAVGVDGTYSSCQAGCLWFLLDMMMKLHQLRIICAVTPNGAVFTQSRSSRQKLGHNFRTRAQNLNFSL